MSTISPFYEYKLNTWLSIGLIKRSGGLLLAESTNTTIFFYGWHSHIMITFKKYDFILIRIEIRLESNVAFLSVPHIDEMTCFTPQDITDFTDTEILLPVNSDQKIAAVYGLL